MSVISSGGEEVYTGPTMETVVPIEPPVIYNLARLEASISGLAERVDVLSNRLVSVSSAPIPEPDAEPIDAPSKPAGDSEVSSRIRSAANEIRRIEVNLAGIVARTEL